MKWRGSRFKRGRVRGIEGCLIMLSASPSEPGSNDDEPNRGGGQSFKEQELNHSLREDDLGSGRYGRNGRYADCCSGDDQPIPKR